MAHTADDHRWSPPYEHLGSTYRDCSQPGCRGHQEWICALDRWSDTFETPSPRARERADDRPASGAARGATR